MKILILIEITSLGGHVISAFTTGRELKKRGHDVHFAAGGGPLSEEIKKQFPFYELDFYHYHYFRETYFQFKSFITLHQLMQIKNIDQFDHIHAFDARSYIIASMLKLIKKIPVTCTLCGSLAPYNNIPICRKLIVFSEEQRDKLINVFGWGKKNIAVISTRIDMEQFQKIDRQEVEDLYKLYNIDPADKNIMMVTNFLEPKKTSILSVLDASRIFLKKHEDVRMVFIGGRGTFFKEAQIIGKKINQELGRGAVFFTGTVVNAYKLLMHSYIVLGVGRSAFEGMAFKKPTLIVGAKGFAGAVSPENIEQLSYYNFAGRNLTREVDHKMLANEILKLVEDQEYYRKNQEFGYSFLKRKIDIKAGIPSIEKAYIENQSHEINNSRLDQVFDITKTLLAIILENYYNFFKMIFMKSGKGKILDKYL